MNYKEFCQVKIGDKLLESHSGKTGTVASLVVAKFCLEECNIHVESKEDPTHQFSIFPQHYIVLHKHPEPFQIKQHSDFPKCWFVIGEVNRDHLEIGPFTEEHARTVCDLMNKGSRS